MPIPQKNFFIRPVKGRKLKDPASGALLPEAGAIMPRSPFWLRRLKDGDVVEARQPAPAHAAKTLSKSGVMPEHAEE